MQKVVLNNGVEIPILGFGVYQVTMVPGEQWKTCIGRAG